MSEISTNDFEIENGVWGIFQRFYTSQYSTTTMLSLKN